VGPYGFDKKRVGSHYTELVFLHLVGSAGHVVHSGKCKTQNVDALVFKLGWDRCGFDKKLTGTRYADLVFFHLVGFMGHVVHSSLTGREMLTHYFSCSGGRVQFIEKARRETLHRTCVFASGGICGSRNGFWFIRGVKRQ
jgi:hypothetical protein